MSDANEKLLTEVDGIVTKQRELAKKFGTESAQYKSYMENADTKMAEFEKAQSESAKQFEETKAANEELTERVKHLEAVAASAGSSGEIDMKKATHEVMTAMVTKNWTSFISDPRNEQKAAAVFDRIKSTTYGNLDGEGAAKLEKMKGLVAKYREKAEGDILRTDIGEYGGYLCPPEFSSELMKNIIEYGPVRKFCKVRTTGSKMFTQVIRTDIGAARRPGEAAPASASGNSKFAKVNFTPYRANADFIISYEEIKSNAYNLVNEMMADLGEQFAVMDGQEFFNGDGVEKGMGFTVDNNVRKIETATTTLGFDDIIGLTGELKRGYDPMFMFNRKTLADLRLMKDGADRYIWNIDGNASAGAPATVAGYRYSSDFIEFDDITTDNGFPILFADMKRFYQIVDMIGDVLIRDDITMADEGLVKYTMMKFCYGKVLKPEAGVALKKKA